ncbi:MAG: LysR family transcriptional regulator [Desulfobacteraceae bacterium]|jgi:DNA-binding transcriptional LysR family regulator
MEFRHLNAFLMVAKQLSFYKAAQRLHYAQSSISAQIMALEDELGVKLFDRLGRSILLTEAGERLMPFAEKIVALTHESRSALGKPKTLKGALTVRVPETLAVCHLPAILERFRARYPQVHLRFITCTHDKLAKDLRKGVTDLAFLITDSISGADLDIEKLGFETLVLVARPDHSLVQMDRVATQQLGGETLLLSRTDCSYRRIMEKILDRARIGVKKTVELNSVAAIKACVCRGLGITIIPRITVEQELQEGKLAVIDWQEDPLEAALLMIWCKGRWQSPTLKAFIDVCRRVLASEANVTAEG